MSSQLPPEQDADKDAPQGTHPLHDKLPLDAYDMPDDTASPDQDTSSFRGRPVGEGESLNERFQGVVITLKPPKPPRYSWSEVWTAAISKPNAQTYAELLDDPAALPIRALLWVYIASIIQLFITLQSLFASFNTAELAGQMGMGAVDAGSLNSSIFISILCMAPFAALFNVGIFWVLSYAVNWYAKNQLHTPDRLAQVLYSFGASTAPISVLTAASSLLGGMLGSLIGFGLLIYQLYLYVCAASATYHLPMRQAAQAALVPAVGLLALQFLLVGFLLG